MNNKLLASAIILVQTIDIGIHVATDQVEPLRIGANLVILIWLGLVLVNKARERLGLATGMSVCLYLSLNALFIILEGVTNPKMGGGFRTAFFLFVGVTVILCIALQRKLINNLVSLKQTNK